MTPTPYESYAIAAGWNVAAISLVNIENITPTSDERFAGPKALPLYDDGQVVPILDGDLDTEGYPAVTWFFTRMTYAQYAYLSSTYCGGRLSGRVTINTTLNNGTYVRMNAWLHLPKPVEIKAEYRYQSASILFTRLVASS